MSLRVEEPRVFGPKEMFEFWAKQKIRKNRHLSLKNVGTHSKDSCLVNNTEDEIKWLKAHIQTIEDKLKRFRGRPDHDMTKDEFYEVYGLRRNVVECRLRLKDLEKLPFKTDKVIMNEKLFREIIYRYNKKMVDALIDGDVVNMGSYLGYLNISKIERGNPNFISQKGNATPNWHASNKRKQEIIDRGGIPKDKEHPEGENWIVYYTDPYYLRYSWVKNKGACRVKNHPFYSFKIARGVNGPTKKLVQANKDNPFLFKKYVDRRFYYPKLDKDIAA